MAVARITYEHDIQRAHIRELIAATAGDPFGRMADFCPPTPTQVQAERIADLEAAMRRAVEQLRPVKKATKAVLEGQIEYARDELARVLEGVEDGEN